MLIIPLTYFLIFGSGQASSRIDELPLTIFIDNWLALIAVISILFALLIHNAKRNRLRLSKSYFITIFLIIILYSLKVPLGNRITDLFQ